MAWVPGGEFAMGSEAFYPEEAPVRRVGVDGFWIDERPVTVADFRRFVKATGHISVAEQPLDPADYPGADPGALVPGSLVLQPSRGPVDLHDFRNWWAYVPGTTWERPEGPASDTYTRGRHPVTQVAYEDAQAYAAWAGKELPTEAEWEYAARGGLDSAVFAWGDEFAPEGRMMANTWQGEFPWQNLMSDGYAGTSPVGSFPPNGYGLYDMTGNVWEWTCDKANTNGAARPCCAPSEAGEHIPRRVIEGGSHLCAPNYCLRYRPAAPVRGDRHIDRAHRVPLRRAQWLTRGQVLAFGLAVGLSPVPIIAVVLMLGTPRARVNGPAFVLGWIVGLTLVGTIILLVAGGVDATGVTGRLPG